MSTEFNTVSHGVTQPSLKNCDEKGNQPVGLQPKRREKYEWELKRFEDLEISDFSMYDDDIKPFMFMCGRFTYKNKAQIQQDKEIRIARAKHKKLSRNLSPFDAITPPKNANLHFSAIPISLTDDLRLRLTSLCKFALDKYNAENQGANFVFADIVKTTWRPGRTYYITFQAQKQEDPSNIPAIIFQAQVQNKRLGPPVVKSCSMKPT
ncbi:hypothetical protein MtrunA17_Chr3g0120981 [Medicago truncatula]|uniref:Cystatin domain protein n=1 Tax=Medicago truncatula TaxID=3880 RepID=G7J9H7_MEDTR|nr:uncharacterized protein LOC120579427 [Medicago truncatula]AES71816.1 hypothetical protein MTR_3g083080 [Medicago truncatula]RHN69090.1 hypothetical protein MtrunA17_Chr3g0120981 [Medicago truncatula]